MLGPKNDGKISCVKVTRIIPCTVHLHPGTYFYYAGVCTCI